MKNLQEYIKQDLQVNESRIRYQEVTNYIKSWLMEQRNVADMKALFNAIDDGIQAAVSERQRFGFDAETTEYIVDHLWVDRKK